MAQQQAAADALAIVLGAGVVAALRDGFRTGGDLRRVIPLLVCAGAKPHLAAAARGALATACDAGRADVADLLLAAKGVGPEDADGPSAYADEHGRHGYSLLSAAARRGDAAVVRALVSSGKASGNHTGGNGNLPVVEAAFKGGACCFSACLRASSRRSRATLVCCRRQHGGRVGGHGALAILRLPLLPCQGNACT